MKMHPMTEGLIRGFSRLHTGLFSLVGFTGLGAFRQTLILTTRGRKTDERFLRRCSISRRTKSSTSSLPSAATTHIPAGIETSSRIQRSKLSATMNLGVTTLGRSAQRKRTKYGRSFLPYIHRTRTTERRRCE